jgi:DNA-binding LacI/PurR family transcriptional regulator
MANMNDIARKANVSLGTVSNVLNETAKVSQDLRKRVLDVIAAIDYQPNQLARGLRRVKTYMIGMIIPDITNPFFPAVVRGAEDAAFTNGYRLVLCNTDNDHSKEIAHLNELRTYHPAGLILIPSSGADLSSRLDSYAKGGTAVVCIDRQPHGWSGDMVTVANEEGAFAATQHLLDLGHKQLAAIGGPADILSAEARLKGFKRALRKAKIKLPPAYLRRSTFDQSGGYANGAALLALNPRPTAIVAGNDLIALGLLRAVREAGLRCPQDISIIGFDNLEIAQLTDPPLASVHQPGYQLGGQAMELLLRQVKKQSKEPKQIVLEAELKIRQSVGPPPAPASPRSRPAAQARRKKT